MIEGQIEALVSEGILAARAAGALDVGDVGRFEVTRPARREHGDWSANAAFVLAKAARMPPRAVAEAIVKHLPSREWVVDVEIAGAGFINFRVSSAWLYDTVSQIIELGPRFGSSDQGAGVRVNVEFVSINPTGPLHIGSARNAVLGDAIGRLLEMTGHDVTREYYFNDAGSQMTNFGSSVAARYLELLGRQADLPEDGYHGSYVVELARQILEEDGESHAGLDLAALGEVMRERAYPVVIAWIERSLERFGVHMDVWFSERTLYESGKVAEVLGRLAELGYVYEDQGAQYLRTTAFGDSRDRVVVRSFGGKEPTYLLPDLAYHLDKAQRSFDQMIVVLGADHHAHGPSLRAGMEALGVSQDRIEVLIYQWVHVLRAGTQLPMSKRAGTFVTLDELIDEVGADAARYTLLHTSADNTVYFDIEEVKKQSLENPVYYVQYAHARIASIQRKAVEQGLDHGGSLSGDVGVLQRLQSDEEIEVMKALASFPETVAGAARTRSPYRVCRYAEDLARRFSVFYERCRVVSDDVELTQARLVLCAATRQVLANALRLLGVRAPERMERQEAV